MAMREMSDRDAVIVAAVRTPVGRASKGSLRDMRADDLATVAVKGALARVPTLDQNLIEDVILGCAFPEGEQGMNVAKLVAILAGIPENTAATTVNRFCASGLQSIAMAAQEIQTGMSDVVVAGGIEAMSRVPMGGFNPSMNRKLFGDKRDHGYPDAYIPMGFTAENIAKKYEISREEQDSFALRSHQKAIAAQDSGAFRNEIVPVALVNGTSVEIDDGPRRDTTVEKLATLKPVFVEGGSVTAGNSSPLNDGAAAVIVMSAAKARELGLTPIARIISAAVAGVAPEFMGMGPVPAVTKALQKAGLKIGDIDIVELNEAFAAQALAVVGQLGIDEERQLNPHGGAIALGHPLGCTGSRIMATLLNDLIVLDKTIGLETMCIGGGQGMAMIVERMN